MAYAIPVVALVTAYTLELGLEWLDAALHRRPPLFVGGGIGRLIDFLLPAHITALACAMLLFSNETLTPIVFAVAVGVCFKSIFRAPLGNGKSSHFFNPSNTGIALTLIAFPWVGVAPPYQFTENVSGVWDWIVPGVIICTGTLLNWRLTKKLPLILGWVGGFLAQAVFRGLFMEFNVLHAISPMTGMAFMLFTFYMITDPGTTPFRPRNQFAFGLSVALVYSVLDVVNLVYQIFFALLVVCVARGILLHAAAAYAARQERVVPSPSPSVELQPAPAMTWVTSADPGVRPELRS
jgi:hypothetical protein